MVPDESGAGCRGSTAGTGDRGTLYVVDQTSAGAAGRRLRALGLLAGTSLLVIAAVLAILPVTAEVAGSTAHCGIPVFALRAPSEPNDKGFNAAYDACSSAGLGRLFVAFLVGGPGAAAVVGSQRLGRRRAPRKQP